VVPRELTSAPTSGGLIRRMAWGISVSILVNLLVWGFAAQLVRHRVAARTLNPVEITRIILPTAPRLAVPLRHPHSVSHPQTLKMHSLVPKTHPRLAQASPSLLPMIPPLHPGLSAASLVARNRVLTSHGSTPAPSTALIGGRALPGIPLSAQGNGARVQQSPPLIPAPPLPRTESTPPHLTPPTHEAALPQADSTTISPAPPKPSDPDGPTVAAQIMRQEKPEIPDELRQDGGYKASVSAILEISVQGTVTNVTLRSSSGSSELDRRIVTALKHWQYQPALKSGRPVACTKVVSLEFAVE
jgi:TonB family protein